MRVTCIINITQYPLANYFSIILSMLYIMMIFIDSKYKYNIIYIYIYIYIYLYNYLNIILNFKKYKKLNYPKYDFEIKIL